ncbi:proteasome activator [Nonomuraea sp. SYSU D8015]|uniref:proteasome activator n=1 Tax=Nonomuraea sp. SYSU D8015 TaxID=2593644 RepID=UPI001660AD07|nr:proteasome activator [Nonomuraea sp. SYSU D8015]
MAKIRESRRGGRGHAVRRQEALMAEIEQVQEPAHLIRVGTMVHQLLTEARGMPLDESARERLLRIHSLAIEEIARSVAPELRDELARLRPDIPGDRPPTQAEIRILHGQLVGWLEGVFQGIQAGLSLQQAAARQELLGLRRAGHRESGRAPHH